MPRTDPSALPQLADSLKSFVSASVRSKGERYFTSGRVGPFDITDAAISATVRGTEEYEVLLAREGRGYLGTCECPFFIDRDEICKHIWAVVVAADAEGVLQPKGANPWLDPEPAGDDDDYIAPGPWRRPVPAPRPQKPAPPPRWQQVLGAITHQVQAQEAAPPPRYIGDGEFVYVIDLGMSRTASGLAVLVMWRQKKKNGEWGKPQQAVASHQELAQLPDSIDREILTLLLGATSTFYGSGIGMTLFSLRGPLLERASWLLASSRRLYLRAQTSTPDELRPLTADRGDPWTFTLSAHTEEDGALTLGGTLVREDSTMSVLEPQLVLADGFMIVRGTLARLDHRGAFLWLQELRTGGAMTFPAEAVPAVVEALARTRVDPAMLPAELRYTVTTADPRPRVVIGRLPHAAPYGPAMMHALVSYDYAGTIVPAGSPQPAFDAVARHLVTRNAAAEKAALQRLHQIGFRDEWSYGAGRGLLISADRLGRAVRLLLEDGWHVEAEGGVYRTARHLHVQVRSGIDWFELHGQVDFGEGRSAPLSSLVEASRSDGLVVLDDGSRGMVPEEWLRRFARLAGFGEVEEGHVRYKPSQTALLDALLESQPDVDVDETFRRARQELRSFSHITPVAPPPTFKGHLREYQQDALGWFDFLRRFGFGGCLADDMGLGKTVMVLALLEGRRTGGGDTRLPSLVVVPRSLVFNWMAEAKRFAPGLRALDYTGAERSTASLADWDLVVATYGTLRRDVTRLMEQEFDYVILDEAQAIKNAATASAKAVRLLRGRHRLALSGTPVENHVGELWSLFEFLNPGLLGSSTAFRRASAVQGRAAGDLALVAQAVRPFILRRTKEQVAPELPPRTEQTIYCELDERHRKFYDEQRAFYRKSLLARVQRDGLSRSKMHVLEALLRLRQAACHPGLVEPRRVPHGSAKFDVLLAQLLEVIDEGHKALVFSQFTSLLALLIPEIESRKIPYEYLDGHTRDRQARVERFMTDPECRLFLISLKAGGLGLNLTEAEYVFLLDPWWNPAVEAQAIDRAHRIGQSRHVFAYRLIAKDTVEEKVAELQASKRELADAILSADPALIRNLKVEDLELLLS